MKLFEEVLAIVLTFARQSFFGLTELGVRSQDAQALKCGLIRMGLAPQGAAALSPAFRICSAPVLRPELYQLVRGRK
jgi:hypothetical protein